MNVLDLGRTQLKLPAGHCILLHAYEKTKSHEAFLFLAVGANVSADSQFSCGNVYSILVLRLPGYILCIGYFVSHTEAMATTGLVSSKDNSILPTIEEKFQTKAVTDDMLPRLLRLRGFSSMQDLLYWLEHV